MFRKHENPNFFKEHCKLKDSIESVHCDEENSIVIVAKWRGEIFCWKMFKFTSQELPEEIIKKKFNLVA